MYMYATGVYGPDLPEKVLVDSHLRGWGRICIYICQ